MNSKIENVEKTTLILNKEEREWLKRLVQNPINHFNESSAYNESDKDKELRGKFFTACGGATKGGEDDGSNYTI